MKDDVAKVMAAPPMTDTIKNGLETKRKKVPDTEFYAGQLKIQTYTNVGICSKPTFLYLMIKVRCLISCLCFQRRMGRPHQHHYNSLYYIQLS